MFMGSSLAPILVERVIEDIVDRALDTLQISPDFWSMYVDDHLTSIPEHMVDTLLDTLNSFEETVQFTVEKQKPNGSIDFLDTTVYNLGSKLKTKWYYKAIVSNRILNYFSKHPVNMIRNVAKSFIRRALQVSHKSFHKEIFKDIHRILCKNNFPESTIRKLIHQVVNSPARKQQNQQKSYPFLQSTIADLPTDGPAANSTMIDNQTIVMQPNNEHKRLTYPKQALVCWTCA